ncbi:PSD1 and planctomycete cytochrome C domain-containing protein [Aureliella helgolandensis]|uniref:Planctomycete cytochrome C n=1 Tax=Aureliella helgolandensis TaxID=2527968 RepID=A0A518G6B4_9BACT|nr:PSD1 and planctomycete cytochrome C domain-containing protein [Aureliella helgolandensis]QDV24130.1 Planctomycete cytochrome C [Aureliella helgolandensis]
MNQASHCSSLGSIASVLLFLISSHSLPLRAGEPPVDFVRDIQPLFETHCYACHAAEKQKSGLRLDIKAEAFQGGDGYGPFAVAGAPDESPIFQLMTESDADMRMPPKGPGLTPEEIETVRRWIVQGAHWPDGVDTAKLVDLRDHWAFHPLHATTPPPVADGLAEFASWPNNAIDHFILHRLEQAELTPNPETDRLTWLRRVSFDLTGLPPTPEQIADFENDRSNHAFESVVDELLASPRYGERWGQHWLDVVRYADTHGFEVNTERANAWPYRDYIIDAFNRDQPYDQMIREQLAGDTLGKDAATGFLVTAAVLLPGQIGKDDASKRLARQDALDEIVINTSEAFLGLSVGCARCHDHKFDPISHREYYAMQAFFSGVDYGERDWRSPATKSRLASVQNHQQDLAEIDVQLQALTQQLAASSVIFDSAESSLNSRFNEVAVAPQPARWVKFIIHDANVHPSLGLIEPCIDEFEIYASGSNTNLALATQGTRVTASGSRPSASHQLAHVNDGQYGNSRSWMSDENGKGWLQFELPAEVNIERVVWSRDREAQLQDRTPLAYTLQIGTSPDELVTVASVLTAPAFQDAMAHWNFSTEQQAGIQELLDRRADIAGRIAELAAVPKVYAGVFKAPEPTHLLLRGDPEQPADPIFPHTPSVLGEVALPFDAGDQTRRTTLANWISQAEHPLTARVMVNRLWQWHFGTGLVATPSDFGWNGASPTHPELLDWLAEQFIDARWSIKTLQRKIVLSATYRQSNQVTQQGAARDADVTLLWRFPSRRLEAEAIRDSMLFTSGRLEMSVGGPGFDLFRSRGGLNGFPPIESFSAEGRRRMIYAHKVRMERESVFGAFDCPDAGQSTARRRQSTTPIQALNLFNSRFTFDESEAFAQRVESEAGPQLLTQVQLAFQLAYGREPSEAELLDAAQFAERQGVPALARVLFNSNEFLFIP